MDGVENPALIHREEFQLPCRLTSSLLGHFILLKKTFFFFSFFFFFSLPSRVGRMGIRVFMLNGG